MENPKFDLRKALFYGSCHKKTGEIVTIDVEVTLNLLKKKDDPLPIKISAISSINSGTVFITYYSRTGTVSSYGISANDLTTEKLGGVPSTFLPNLLKKP